MLPVCLHLCIPLFTLQPDQLTLEDSVVVCRYISNPLLIDGLIAFHGLVIIKGMSDNR